MPQAVKPLFILNDLPIHKLKILNDPVYGFITISNRLLFHLIEHPFFQRLRRITQMGFSNLVYPGANHTRFHHAVGCMHLMQEAVRVLRFKGISISEEEATALYIAVLLHDIGHGPFSHTLENSIIRGVSHEEISLRFMRFLNKEFDGELDLAIEIFEGKYHRHFFNQLISSQLDIDRLDYLKRDSFYTGVVEGNISSDRLIAMMHVVRGKLVIEKKGIYSVENFLIARRLMYWQVYLHKTSLVAEQMLVKILQRAKELVQKGAALPATKTMRYFLHNQITKDNFTEATLSLFSKLDDYDVLSSIKEWVSHSDYVLSTLSKMIMHRDLLKIKMQNDPLEEGFLIDLKRTLSEKLPVEEELLHYFVFEGKVSNQAYSQKKPIEILHSQGSVEDVVQASDQLHLQALARPVEKYYVCYPKKMKLD